MNSFSNYQNIYIRKLNGLGQQISVLDTLTIHQLKNIVRSLKSLELSDLQSKDFDLIFKGKNINQKSEQTLKQLGIQNNGIIDLLFASQEQKGNDIHLDQSLSNSSASSTNLNGEMNSVDIKLKVMFNDIQHEFIMPQSHTVLDLKKKIAAKLNLIFQSLVLCHLGTQMFNQKQLSTYELENNTLISVRFNLQKPEKKRLQSRMVSSVTFSDQNNEPNHIKQIQELTDINSKLVTSSKSIESDKDYFEQGPQKLTSLMDGNSRSLMYKSDINSFCTQGTSKAALMFKNALHQKIVETESVVSGSFSEDFSLSGCDPNSLMITVKNEEDTKEFVFECSKTHQIINIRQKLFSIEKIQSSQKVEISMEEDLFQSIDLTKSGCLTLSEIVKKMGKQRAVFIYRII